MPALTSDRRDTLLPGPLNRIGYVVTIRRRKAKTDTQVGQFRVWIVPAMKLGDRLGVAFTSLRLYQHAFLEMRLEQALQGNKECRAVVAVPIGVSAGHNFRVVNLHFNLRVARQRRIEGIEKKISVKAVSWWHYVIELELQIFVVVGSAMHRIAPRTGKQQA